MTYTYLHVCIKMDVNRNYTYDKQTKQVSCYRSCSRHSYFHFDVVVKFTDVNEVTYLYGNK